MSSLVGRNVVCFSNRALNYAAAFFVLRHLAVPWGKLGVIPGEAHSEGAHAAMKRQKRGPVHHLVGAWDSTEHAFELLQPHLL